MMTGVFVYAQSNACSKSSVRRRARCQMSLLVNTPESHGVTYPLYEYCLRITTIVSTLTRYGQLLESLSLTWSSLCGARVHDSPERNPYLLVRTGESCLIHRKGEGLEESGGMTKNSPRRGTSLEAA